MATYYHCAKCNKLLKQGFFTSDGFEKYEGKIYCRECFDKIPKPKNYGKTCYFCAYYGIDQNSDGFCKRDFNRYVSWDKKACDHYDGR